MNLPREIIQGVVAWAPGAAESARSIAELYSVTLITSLLLVCAALVGFVLRRMPAGTRALVWRSSVAAPLAVYVGHLLPVQWVADVVPAGLAAPMVVLGRVQVLVDDAAAGLSDSGASVWVRLLFAVYCAGVLVVLAPVVAEWHRARRLLRRTRPPADPEWTDACERLRRSLGIRRAVTLLVSDADVVPFTLGIRRPVVVLPRTASTWSDARRRAVLLHELAHVRGGDVMFGLAARLACALLWYHPGVWWIARELRAECELAADDRVLAEGVRPSDYAELLVQSAQHLGGASVAVALARRGGLRRRLVAIADVQRDLRAPGHRAHLAAVLLTMALALPATGARLAPSRDVLTALMRDARWESRAYAAIGLAQRPDSIEIARAASRLDPNPRVRAWARLAVERVDIAPRISSRWRAIPALQLEPR